MRTFVYTGWSGTYKTWDIFQDTTNECLFYGSIDEIEQWLIDHRFTHVEVHL